MASDDDDPLPPLPDEEVALLEAGHEARHVEFKGAGTPKDKEFLAKVSRAAIAVSNLRDGGSILIGIDDKDPAEGWSGLAVEDGNLWTDHDTIADAFAAYCDPPIRFEGRRHRHPKGFVVARIKVEEFDQVPTLCKKDYPGVLVRGRLYMRSKGKPQTTDTFESGELRELLDLAGEKRAREILAQQLRITPPTQASGPVFEERDS